MFTLGSIGVLLVNWPGSMNGPVTQIDKAVQNVQDAWYIVVLFKISLQYFKGNQKFMLLKFYSFTTICIHIGF